MESSKIPVTVVIPTKNEIKNISRCLDLLDRFQQIVVVDSQSTDGTREAAKAAGATVVDFNWEPGQLKKRNWVLTHYALDTDWVLFLDADEFVTEAFINAVDERVRKTEAVGFWLHYRLYFMGKLLRHGVSQKKLALIRSGAGFYEKICDLGWTELDMEVHEHPILDGPIDEILEPIDHLDYKGLFHFIKKHNEYSTWEANRYASMRENADSRFTFRQHVKYRYLESWWFSIAYFIIAYIFQLGFLDGAAGFRYALYKGIYFFQVRDKIQELKRANASPVGDKK